MPTRENVTTGKAAVGGAVFWADPATTLPTDTTTALDAAFVDLGYCSTDGLKNNQTKSSQDVKAWGGDVVDSHDTEHADVYTVTLIEGLNPEVLKAARASANVSGTLATGITVKANRAERDYMAWVVDMVGKDALIRHVLPCAKVTAVAEVQYTDTNVLGYQLTLAAYPNSLGDTHYEYIKATS